MYGHHRLDAPEKLTAREALFQIDRNKTGLPVMAVNHVRTKADQRKRREQRAGKEGKFLEVVEPVAVGAQSAEIALIVDEIKGDAVFYQFKTPT